MLFIRITFPTSMAFAIFFRFASQTAFSTSSSCAAATAITPEAMPDAVLIRLSMVIISTSPNQYSEHFPPWSTLSAPSARLLISSSPGRQITGATFETYEVISLHRLSLYAMPPV